LAPEVHINSRALNGGASQVLHGVPQLKRHEQIQNHAQFTQKNSTLASLIPVSLVLGRSSTRKAAKLAVYEATMIMANPAHTIPSTLALKLLGVPSPIPLLRSTPHANQIALDKLRASSSVPSVFPSLKRPNGENLTQIFFTFQILLQSV